MLYLKKSFIGIVIFILICNYSIGQGFNPADTVYPFQNIVPFELDLTDSINFPLQTPKAIGDINGDGFGDFAFVKNAANEKTANIIDRVQKSAIITDINNPKSAYIIYNASVQEIGDYNGDGFDDMLIGAYGNDDGGDRAGKTYLVFGRSGSWPDEDPLGTRSNASFIGGSIIIKSDSKTMIIRY